MTTTDENTTSEQPPKRKILTLKEASAYLRIHPNTMTKLVRTGAVPGKKLGAHWRFLESELEKFMHEGDKWPE